jgi:hypothetical protein
MNNRTMGWVLAGALAVTAPACRDDDEAASGALTLKQFAASDIAGNTRDDNAPVELNDLFVDTSNEDPAQYDDLLPSS